MRISDWSSDVCSSDLIALLIEPASPLHADLHIAHTLRDTVTLAEMAGLGVCIDLFCCWSEAGLRATIERAIPRCGIVQVSDYVYGDRAMPCRAVPGDGALPIRTMLAWMLGAGYEGAEIGSAHVCTPVTNAHLVCRL